jgi:predicted nucleotidyltransferase
VVVDELLDVARSVPPLVVRLPGVVRVDLGGSRRRGDAGRLSDWDFVVQTEDFPATAATLPAAMESVDLLAAQWDRLSSTACFMLIGPRPVKIDLIFDGVPHAPEPPWAVTASTLAAVDAHFWDWSLWLASKVEAGKRDLVEAELEKMHAHLLEPLGVARPRSLAWAVSHYVEAVPRWERRLGVSVDRSLQDAVVPVIQIAVELAGERAHGWDDAPT